MISVTLYRIELKVGLPYLKTENQAIFIFKKLKADIKFQINIFLFFILTYSLNLQSKIQKN